MILTCDSCMKQFVVPDSAITASGRMVQCGSCGNKWRQFPENKTEKEQSISKPQKIASKTQALKPKIQKTKKTKKIKKRKGPDLYSPEYLSKKHGIKIQSTPLKEEKTKKIKDHVSFGFYNYLIVFSVSLISLLKLIHFAQGYIVIQLPMLEVYLKYLFETIRNLTDIIKNFLTVY